jgi:hypothetical protein
MEMVGCMSNEKSINDAVDYLYTHGKKYAESKAHRGYLENYTKTLIASLAIKFIKDGVAKSMAQAEAMAYADPSYETHISGLQEAVEIEEKLRWGLTSAQARIEVYRTQSANERAMDRATI